MPNFGAGAKNYSPQLKLTQQDKNPKLKGPTVTEPLLPFHVANLVLDNNAAKDAGEKLGPSYQSKLPFPYGCFDNFLPEEILDRVLEDLQIMPEPERSFDRSQERYKSSYIPERLPAYTRSVLYALNSRPFILFLERLTGINGLIPDPYFMGGGIHVVENGGHLDIHADFNHHKPMNLERRLNVLIYLNKDWKEEYGGAFEIWSKDMSHKVEGFAPIFNRMCCFNTGSDTFHGNPDPVNHPKGTPRRSIALYYYTATWDDSRKAHTTQFKPRPNSKDKKDTRVARNEFLADLLPPILYRRIAGPLRRLGF
ncbi:2OG-Fe(II) oxygenase [Hwanghaeella sp.]|uniref:2OG-Fe(II) oxygenase n=1 Tax=Hwanghaeella sp. TaxID=2605943 RepID=UPI003CCBD19F